MSTSRLGPLAQISRSVRDIQESQAWYADTLGLAHLYTYGTLAFFDCGGTRLYLQQEAEPKPESILYLRVEDIRTAGYVNGKPAVRVPLIDVLALQESRPMAPTRSLSRADRGTPRLRRTRHRCVHHRWRSDA